MYRRAVLRGNIGGVRMTDKVAEVEAVSEELREGGREVFPFDVG